MLFRAKELRLTAISKVLSISMAGLLTVLPVAPSLGSTTKGEIASRNLVLEKKFANCSALNKVYPGGVAKSSKAKNKGGATNYAPEVNSKIYEANKGKDRDKDGIACER